MMRRFWKQGRAQNKVIHGAFGGSLDWEQCQSLPNVFNITELLGQGVRFVKAILRNVHNTWDLNTLSPPPNLF